MIHRTILPYDASEPKTQSHDVAIAMLEARIVTLLLCLFLLQPLIRNAEAEEFSGRVGGVLDRDTIEVLHLGKAERIRLNGIDCQQIEQAFGHNAKQFTAGLTLGKVVTVRAVGFDQYGHPLGEIFLPDGRNLNRKLVKAGLAWWYRRYSSDQTSGEVGIAS